MRSSLIIFEYLDDDDISWIHKSCRKQHLRAGECLIEQGILNKSIYLLLDGKCNAFAADGKKLGDLLMAGDMIGEVSFVDGRRTTARVVALTDVVLAVLDHDVLSEHFEEEPAFAARFFQAVASVLAYRLRSNMQVRITGDQDIMNPTQEFSGEIDAIDLDGTARSGARLANLIDRLL